MARHIIELAACTHLMEVFISMARYSYILEGDQAVETRMKNCEGINRRLAYLMTINKAQGQIFDKV